MNYTTTKKIRKIADQLYIPLYKADIETLKLTENDNVEITILKIYKKED